MDRPTETPSSTTDATSLAVRGGILVVLVVLFQYCVANAANLAKETKRRFQHALTGHALVQISYFLPQAVSLGLLVAAALAMYVAKTCFFESFLKAFGGLLRPRETSGEVLPGAFWFLVGTAAVVVPGLVTADLRIARCAVECLALADPMASWVGSTVPSPKLVRWRGRTASLSGCLACFGTALGVGWWMLPAQGGDASVPATTTLVAGALACTIAEALPVGNDNLTIPIATAWVVDRVSAAAAAAAV